ncbi:MAG: glycoside hydrolase family 88 protein [Bacteroidales bacterium]|nr:glycoside hydrolase family 88 protein [Bacteroidales bacterium]
MKFYNFCAVVLAFAVTSCGSPIKKVIKDHVRVADVQVKALAAASDNGTEVKIPHTFQNGKIKFVGKSAWTSGFFAGTLWEMYALTGDKTFADYAKRQTDNLEEIKFLTSHHDIGFMMNSSFGGALQYAPDLVDQKAYKDVLIQSAKSLCTRFHPGAGIIQSWNTSEKWLCPVIIDNMMNLELLFKATQFSGDSTYWKVAVSHADKTLQNHFRSDYSTYHVVDYDPETGEIRAKQTAQGYGDETAWARGQSWGLYGFTMAYRFTKDQRYLDQAEHIANFLLTNKTMPEDLVPYWDFDCPDIPNTYREVTCAAIMASAFCELYSITGKQLYLDSADKIITSLAKPEYRAAPGENGNFILMHSCSTVPGKSEVDVPLNYADYYLLEALIRRQKL